MERRVRWVMAQRFACDRLVIMDKDAPQDGRTGQPVDPLSDYETWFRAQVEIGLKEALEHPERCFTLDEIEALIVGR